jgi:hypothetical protein
VLQLVLYEQPAGETLLHRYTPTEWSEFSRGRRDSDRTKTECNKCRHVKKRGTKNDYDQQLIKPNEN